MLTVKELHNTANELDNKKITIEGWVKTIRSSNAFGFIELNDGTAFKNVQVVIESGALENYNEVTKFSIYSAVRVTGTLVLTPDAKQAFEIHANNVEVFNK